VKKIEKKFVKKIEKKFVKTKMSQRSQFPTTMIEPAEKILPT